MLILLLHLAVTCFLTGLIWLVQVVQYPLFAQVGPQAFAAYHAGHSRQISWVVGPAMLLELLLAGVLLLGSPSVLTALGAGLVAVVWLSTALVQVPLHARLSGGHDPRIIRRLVLGNWIRTLAWSARAGLALTLAARALPG